MSDSALLQLDPRVRPYLAAYPAELFSDHFHTTCEQIDRYALELTQSIAERIGLHPHLSQPVTVADLEARLDFVPTFRPALSWVLARLAESGVLSADEVHGERRFWFAQAPRSEQSAALRQACLEHDPAAAPTLDLLAAAAAVYPVVARGEARGEEALLGPGQVGLWCAYFSNANSAYAVNNRVAAVAAAERLPAAGELRILEVGAGAGSGAEALLDELARRGQIGRLHRYEITEPSPFFRRRAERMLRARFPQAPLQFGALDINLPWAAQANEPAGFDLVLGVNVLHVAHDLRRSLAAAREVLAPGRWLILGECLRPFPGQPIWAELIFQLLEGFTNVVTEPEIRPNPGFLTPEQWRSAFAAGGFQAVTIEPEVERIRDWYPRFFTGAICGQRGQRGQRGQHDPSGQRREPGQLPPPSAL